MAFYYNNKKINNSVWWKVSWSWYYPYNFDYIKTAYQIYYRFNFFGPSFRSLRKLIVRCWTPALLGNGLVFFIFYDSSRCHRSTFDVGLKMLSKLHEAGRQLSARSIEHLQPINIFYCQGVHQVEVINRSYQATPPLPPFINIINITS